MIMMIDHNDSFTYNVVDYIEQTGEKVIVLSYREVTVDKVLAFQPRLVVLSPGPGNPNDVSESITLLQNITGQIPVLGVCLGFQIIIHTFGGRISQAEVPMHGKREWVRHDGEGIFTNIDSPTQVTRYHSLSAQAKDIPSDLKVTSWTEQGDVMAVRHREYSIEAVQFHPEAILTTYGKKMIQNTIRHMTQGGARVE